MNKVTSKTSVEGGDCGFGEGVNYLFTSIVPNKKFINLFNAIFQY